MSTLNTIIYSRSISEFNDPYISAAYNENSIEFFKIMYNFLINAIPLVNTPSSEVIKLTDVAEASGETELFDGDGIADDFVLTTIPVSGSYFYCTVASTPTDMTFNYNTNTATLSFVPPIGTESVSIEWYYPGQFNQTLAIQEQNILGCFLVSCWAEKEKNFLMDIRRLLNDTDFHLASEAPNIQSKGNWYYLMREKAEKYMMQYAWTLHLAEMKTRYNLT